MRPLYHPPLENVTVEGILHALADPVRVAIFTEVAGSGCRQNCSNFLQVSERAIPRSTLSQHFKALREAGLIRGERQGVEMFNTSRCAEINERFPGLIEAILKAHRIQQEDTGRKERAARRKAASRSAKGRGAGVEG
ncbi:MAG: helix-turn-helix domain-containing protein [Acidobacteriaceae bacterium]